MTPTLTPTGTKPIPPRTAAKLQEARDHLNEMELASESSDEFRRAVGSFLTAMRSVKDVLKGEIARGNRAAKDFIENAMKADPEMESLIDARDGHIHVGNFQLDIEWTEDSFPAPHMEPGLRDFWRRFRLRRSESRRQLHRSSRVVGMPTQPPERAPRAFFSTISDRDVYTVCANCEHWEAVWAHSHG